MNGATEKAAAEKFAGDVAAHEMTVLHEDGPYRHIRFRRPAGESSAYWFDLITWPRNLTITGDCGTFTFACAEDMFEFFRGGRINPGYWAEKIRVGNEVPGQAATGYSEQKFRQLVAEHVAEYAHAWPGLAEAVEEEFFGDLAEWNTEYEHDAHEALRSFEFGATFTVKCPTCGTLDMYLGKDRADRLRHDHLIDHLGGESGRGHIALPKRDGGFRFDGSWEWDLRDWDWWYLWCCHAIQWGIARYDEARVAAHA